MTPQEAAEQYTNKLLPCPLCNGQPGEHVFFAGYMAPGNYQAKCTQCHLIVSQDRIDKVIGIWNQRCFMPSQLSSALKEIAELTRWKNEMLQLWNKLDAYLQTRNDTRLGESKIDFVIKVMKEQEALQRVRDLLKNSDRLSPESNSEPDSANLPPEVTS